MANHFVDDDHGTVRPSSAQGHGQASVAAREPARPRNYILSHMPEAQYAAIARHLVPVELPVHMKLSEPNQDIEYVYFPTSGLISTDALTEAGDSIEVGLPGARGFRASMACWGIRSWRIA